MVSKSSKLAALGLGLGLLASPSAEAQNSGEYNDRWNGSSSSVYSENYENGQNRESVDFSQINAQDYNIIEREMDDGERLRNLQSDMRSEYLPQYGHKLEAILNNTEPLDGGDKITVVESQTPGGVYYPYYINMDYSDPKKRDLELIASVVPEEEDRPFRFTLLYHNFEGRRHMTLWNNKERPGFFQAEGPYPNIAQFILPGSMDDYRLTSPFGEREDPSGESTGGSTTRFHPANDWARRDRSNIYGEVTIAPMDGFVRFGYYQKPNTDDSTVDDEKSSGRYVEFKTNGNVPVLFNGSFSQRQVGNSFYHTRAPSEEMLFKAVNQLPPLPNGERNLEWWSRTLAQELNSSFSEEDLIENIRNLNESGKLRVPGISTGWIPVKQGDVIGRVDNTGKIFGTHLHHELSLNGIGVDPATGIRVNPLRMVRVDPSMFYQYNGILQDYSLQEMEERKNFVESILED